MARQTCIISSPKRERADSKSDVDGEGEKKCYQCNSDQPCIICGDGQPDQRQCYTDARAEHAHWLVREKNSPRLACRPLLCLFDHIDERGGSDDPENCAAYQTSA